MIDAEEVVRDTWKRWNEGLRAADPEVMDPEIEIHSKLTDSVYRGYEELPRWSAEIDEQFETWRIAVTEIRALTDERVLVLGEIHARGRQSGVDIEQPAAWTVELRGGRILRIRNFLGSDAAEAALASSNPDRGCST
jgi:ketosteroid isomerase-like protein